MTTSTIEVTSLHYIVGFLNLSVCMVIMYFCICRLNSKASKHFTKIRLKFLLLLIGATASGLQPVLWAHYPDVGSLIFSSCMLIYMVINKSNRRG